MRMVRVGLAVVLGSIVPVCGQVIDVGDGEVLTQADLEAGEFGGQTLSLGPGLEINVWAGGRVELSDLDMQGTTVSVHADGMLEGTFGSQRMNALVLNAFEDADITGTLYLDNSTVRLLGADLVGWNILAQHCHVLVTGGVMGAGLFRESTAEVRVRRCELWTLDLDRIELGEPGERFVLDASDFSSMCGTLSDGTPMLSVALASSPTILCSCLHLFPAQVTIVVVCGCDENGDGVVGFDDLLRYVGGWFAGEERADRNHDGVVDVVDLLDHVDCYLDAVTNGGACG